MLHVKAVDIARELGISKATVSMALNGKPGVKEKTRQMVLECKERLENPDGEYKESDLLEGKVIKIIRATKGLRMVMNDDVNIWADKNVALDRIAKSWGSCAEEIYFDLDYDSSNTLADICNKKNVAGVILAGTELTPEDRILFQKINKPMVVHDCEMGDEYPCVILDNRNAIRKAVEHLLSYQKKNIVYLSRSIDVYNYISRRNAFRQICAEKGLTCGEQIIPMGKDIREITENIQEYLKNHPLPDAFLFESYHLSVAAITAFERAGISIPKDVSAIGIDMIPQCLQGQYELTTVHMPHYEHVHWIMLALKHEIYNQGPMKSKIYINGQLVIGDSVCE